MNPKKAKRITILSPCDGSLYTVALKVRFARIMNSMLSERVQAIEASPTLALTGKVAALTTNGVDVINFGAGEPDFSTPSRICEAAHQAIRDGKTRYTPGAGIMELRKAIAERLLSANKVRVEPTQVVVSCGAKQAVYSALMALVNPGDEVILIAPFWMTYRDQVILAGGKPVIVQTVGEQSFLPDPDVIRAAVTAKTRVIVLNSPSNPSGAVYPRSLLKEIAAIAIRHDLQIVSDEIYEKLIYDGAEHHSIASLGEEVLNRTTTINGVSKTFAMTGWRIGWSAAPPEISKSIAKLQDQITSNANSIAQYASLAALTMPEEEVEQMVCEFNRRRTAMVAELRKIPGVSLLPPCGAFYAFADFSGAMADRIGSDVALAELLLDQANVACIPGSVFGAENHLRLSYTIAPERIALGVERIGDALANLR